MSSQLAESWNQCQASSIIFQHDQPATWREIGYTGHFCHEKANSFSLYISRFFLSSSPTPASLISLISVSISTSISVSASVSLSLSLLNHSHCHKRKIECYSIFFSFNSTWVSSFNYSLNTLGKLYLWRVVITLIMPNLIAICLALSQQLPREYLDPSFKIYLSLDSLGLPNIRTFSFFFFCLFFLLFATHK